MQLGRKQLYKIYEDGKLISKGSAKELAEEFNCRNIYFSQYSRCHYLLFGRYLVKSVEIPKRPKKETKPRVRKEYNIVVGHKIPKKNNLKLKVIYSQDIGCGSLVDIIKFDEMTRKYIVVETCRVNAVYRHIFTVKRKAGYIEAFTFIQLYRKDGVRLSQQENIT